jgi:hypothetical protein
VNDTLPNGQGTCTWPNGDTYTGDFVLGQLHGKGTYTMYDVSYTGDFVNGRVHGQGTLTWSKGDTYTGDFVNNRRTGHGTLTWSNGNTYTGDFVNDSRTGKGTYTWSDGSLFVGDFLNNKWVNGRIYKSTFTGSFVDFISPILLSKIKERHLITNILLFL